MLPQMPDQLLVIRAGPTEYDLAGRIRGTLAVPLAAAGVAAAERVAAELAASPPDALFGSDDAAAAETGRIVADGCGLRLRRVAGLANLDQGLWQGMLVDDIRRKQPRLYRQWQDNPWAVAPPEGELLEDACQRVEAALEPIARRWSGRVAIVVPAPLDRIVRWIVAGRSMGDLWDGLPTSPNCDVLPLSTQWLFSRPAGTRARQRASG
jgi:broad specificity phosphatase PhoE